MIILDFDKVKKLKKEYKNDLRSYNIYYNQLKSLKKELHYIFKETDLKKVLLHDLNKSVSKIKQEINITKKHLKNYNIILTELKKQIKEAERDFEDDVKLFYLDFENHYGQPYKSDRNPLRYFTNSENLKTNMKYFYYNIKQINKQ